MRITNGMLINNMMGNLNSNLNRLSKYNDQGASGRKFDKPSDDPIGMSKSLKLYTDVSKIEQYERNLRDANSWMHTTEDSIAEIGEILQRTREVAVDASNGPKTEEDTKAIAEEIKQLKEQLVKLGNTRHAGRSIFTGHKTNQDLFKVGTDGSVTYNIDVKSVDVSIYNVGISENIEVNIVGSKVFGVFEGTPLYGGDITTDDEPNLLKTFDKLIAAMGASNDPSGFNQTKISDSLEEIDDIMEQVLGIRAEIGAKTNRLEMTEKRLSSERLNFRSVLSQNEDVDYAELIMQSKLAENIYNASLAMGSKIIQPTLMDFLR